MNSDDPMEVDAVQKGTRKEKGKAKIKFHKTLADIAARRATGQRIAGRSSRTKTKERERTKAKGSHNLRLQEWHREPQTREQATKCKQSSPST